MKTEQRVIKFRGQRIGGKDFVYGSLDITASGLYYIRSHSIQAGGFGAYLATQVDPYTVGQFTGLVDKEGNDVYEGDLVRILYTDWPSKSSEDPRTLEQYKDDISHIGVVVFADNGWNVMIEYQQKKYAEDFYYASIDHGKHGQIKVIGNIYQHPHLLPSTTTI